MDEGRRRRRGVRLGRVAVASAVLVLAGCAGNRGATERESSTVLLISLDGFRWDYPSLAATPTLDRLAASGARAQRLIPVFPTKTFPSHYSIVTGLYPDRHGVVSNQMFDPVFDARAELTRQEDATDSRWWAGEPIWVTAAKQGYRSGTMFWPGSEAAIGGIRPTYWRRFDDAVPNHARVEQVLAWLDLPDAARPQFITCYFSSVDVLGHRHGPESAEVRAGIGELDAVLGALVDGLVSRGLLDRINLLVVSDHGMTSVSPDRVIFLDDYVDVGRIQVVEWSPVAFLRPDPAYLPDAHAALAGAHPQLTVYAKPEIPDRLHLGAHRRVTPLLAIASEGWTISTRPRWQARARLLPGEHGYDNRLRSMHGIFLAHGPAFRRGVVVDAFDSVHVYELMAHVLGVRPAPNDGDLEQVRTLLVD